MGATPNAHPNHQILSQENTLSVCGKSPCDELWQLWCDTESADRVLNRFGQLLREVQYWERSEMLRLVGLWRHIACTAEVLREDREIELFNLMCKGRRWSSTGRPKCTCVNLRADDMDGRVWSEVVALLSDPERLATMAADHLATAHQASESVTGELARVESQITKLEASVTTTIVEYAKAGLPADAIKAATDQINAELVSLKRRRAELSASQPAALADVPDLMSIARSRLAAMTLDEQTEVLGLLDIRVTVLEQARRPRVRIEGTVPHATAGGSTLVHP